jgi:hypothetical protein
MVTTPSSAKDFEGARATLHLVKEENRKKKKKDADHSFRDLYLGVQRERSLGRMSEMK